MFSMFSAGGRRRRRGRVLAAGAAGLVALSVAACSSAASSSSSTASTASGASTASSATGSAAASSASGANLSAAQAAIAPYTGHPSAFPVGSPLTKALPAGTKIGYLQCGASICALVGTELSAAVKAIGGQLVTVPAGNTASTAQAAAASMLTLKPAAVLVTGIIPSEYGGGLLKLQAAGIKVVSISVGGPTKQYGIDFNYVGLSPLQLAGRLMADWVIAHKGPGANVVFYGIPEVAFNPYMEAAFKQELATNCSSCTVRFDSIDITAIGSSAPSTIVTDLQSHPSTNVAVFEAAEIAEGVPAALKSAGINVTTLGYTPEPEELQYIKDGQMTAGLAADFPTQIWTTVDIMARLIDGQSPTAGEVSGIGPFQFLSQSDITFNPSHGWTGYPTYAQTFAKLWNPAG